MKEKYNFEDFIQIMDKLRGEGGCSWDRVQTHHSLKKCMLEEAYEVVEAIDNNDMANLCEELGDVLLQVVFHAKIESENKQFDINDVIDGISKKMISRHTHIFSNDVANTPEEVAQNWEQIKKKEKALNTQTEVLKSVPKALPSLMRASKVQSKASEVGFDFSDIDGAIEKVKEETEELKAALSIENGNVEEEFGDILFSLVNIARFLQLNPEFALTKATEKFINRFEYVEKSAISQSNNLSEMSLEEMDILWEQSKQHGY